MNITLASREMNKISEKKNPEKGWLVTEGRASLAQ